MTRVLILYNQPTLPADHPDACSEHEIIYTVDRTEEVLRAAGYQTSRLGVHVDPRKMIDGIKRARPDVVFNLFEGLPMLGQTEAFAAGLMDWLGIPYTGCAFQSLVVARSKPLTKQMLKGAGVATANFRLVDDGPIKPCKLGWPVIVKPSNQDASVGVAQSSVVTSQVAYEERVRFVLAEYGGPVLVEEYIPGREFNVAVVEAPELRALPPWEVKFTRPSGEAWPIITYEAKWAPGSADYEASPCEYKPVIEPRLRRRLESTACKAFRLLGCRDIARLDFRVSAEGKPYVLEVNPNPDISPTGGITECLEAAGLTHPGFVKQMVENALARGATRLQEPVGIQLIEW